MDQISPEIVIFDTIFFKITNIFSKIWGKLPKIDLSYFVVTPKTKGLKT